MNTICVLIFEYTPSFLGFSVIVNRFFPPETAIICLGCYAFYLLICKSWLINRLDESLIAIEKGIGYFSEMEGSLSIMLFFAPVEIISIGVGYWVLLDSIL